MDANISIRILPTGNRHNIFNRFLPRQNTLDTIFPYNFAFSKEKGEIFSIGFCLEEKTTEAIFRTGSCLVGCNAFSVSMCLPCKEITEAIFPIGFYLVFRQWTQYFLSVSASPKDNGRNIFNRFPPRLKTMDTIFPIGFCLV